MHSCAWRNGQYQQGGPQSSQTSQTAIQPTYDPMWTQQAERANNLYHYRTTNMGVQPPQSAHLGFHNGAYYNRQTSNWQTSASPHQAVSSKHLAGGETNSYYPTVLHGNRQNSLTNMQSENPQPNPGFTISPTQIPPQMMKANTTYPQQDMSAQLNQKVPAHWKQSVRHDGDAGSVCRILRNMLQQNSGDSGNLPSASHQVLSVAHNRQTQHSLNERQNCTQHGRFPSTAPPSYSTAVSQSLRNNNTMTNSPSSKQVLHISSRSQKTQQYPTHLTTTPNYREQATCRFVSKGNELPLNPAAEPQEKMLRSQMITRIADNLQKSFPARSDGRPPVHTSPSYREKQQLVTLTVPESYNSSGSHSLAPNSDLPLPTTTHSVMNRTQQSADAPQQSSASNVFYVSATGDGISHTTVKANDGSIHSSPGRTGVRAVAVVQPLSQESYQVASRHMSSNTTSQSAEQSATDESVCYPEKSFISSTEAVYLREGPYCHPEKTNQTWSNKSSISHSAASTDGTFVSPSHEQQQNFSQKQLSADNTEFEQAIKMRVDQCVAPTAQWSQTSKAPASTSPRSDSDQSETPSDPKAGVYELSSVPTSPWTPHLLNNLILNAEKDQANLSSTTVSDSTSKLLGMFWNGTSKNLASKLKSGWYKDVITEVSGFCSKHVTLETVVLSQVQKRFKKQLRLYHVLKDDDVYFLPPYKSSWLNVNEQLDDIDKEYGHSWSLKHHPHVPETHNPPDQVETVGSMTHHPHVPETHDPPDQVVTVGSMTHHPHVPETHNPPDQVETVGSMTHHPHVPETHNPPDQVGTVGSIHAQSAGEVPIKVLSQTEQEPVDSCEEKQASTLEATSTQALSPDDTESADSSDSLYSFEIKVLPPEEAKAIFEQIESQMSQSMDTDSQPTVTISSVEGELPEATGVTLDDSKPERRSVCNIEQICCISRWVEIINGPSTGSLTCECKREQSAKIQREDNLHAIGSDGKNHTDGKSQAKDGENIMTDGRTELCNALSQTIVFYENDLKTHSYSDEDSKNTSHVSINSSQSDILFISDDDLSSCDTEIQLVPEVDYMQGQFESTGSAQPCTLVSSDKETENLPGSEREVASQMLDLEENNKQTQLTSSDVAASSLETDEQTQISVTATFSLSGKQDMVERKRKGLSSDDPVFPLVKKSNKCKPPLDVESQPLPEGAHKYGKVLVDATDRESSASNASSVQLVLFGSAPQGRCVSVGSKNRSSNPNPGLDEVHRPPAVLTVKLSPRSRKPGETVPTGERSVKRRIYEKWWRNHTPIKMKHRRHLTAQKLTVPALRLNKAEEFSPFSPSAKRLPVSDNMPTLNRNTKRCASTRWALSNKLKRREEKAVVTLPADQKSSNAENGSRVFMPLQEKIVLEFSVLPKTFTFNTKKETNDTVPNEPALVEEQRRRPNSSVSRRTVGTAGTWYPSPGKKYRPLHSPPVPKTSSLFHEFQRKYRKKPQPPKDE